MVLKAYVCDLLLERPRKELTGTGIKVDERGSPFKKVGGFSSVSENDSLYTDQKANLGGGDRKTRIGPSPPSSTCSNFVDALYYEGESSLFSERKRRFFV